MGEPLVELKPRLKRCWTRSVGTRHWWVSLGSQSDAEVMAAATAELAARGISSR